MSFLESMQNRYTTKRYDDNKEINTAQIEELKAILQLSPSSINSQPWKFTFVSDKNVRQQLSEVSWHNTDKVLNCQCVIVFSRIDSISDFEHQIEQVLPEGAINYFKHFIKPLPEDEIRHWFEKQVYLSLGILLSACASMNIDSTPMEGIEAEQYDKILKLDGYKSIVAVAIGCRDMNDTNQTHIKPKTRLALQKIVKTI